MAKIDSKTLHKEALKTVQSYLAGMDLIGNKDEVPRKLADLLEPMAKAAAKGDNLDSAVMTAQAKVRKKVETSEGWNRQVASNIVTTYSGSLYEQLGRSSGISIA